MADPGEQEFEAGFHRSWMSGQADDCTNCREHVVAYLNGLFCARCGSRVPEDDQELTFEHHCISEIVVENGRLVCGVCKAIPIYAEQSVGVKLFIGMEKP